MSYTNAISSGDPLAIETLTEKLKQCEKLQEVMREVNAFWRKFGTCTGSPDISEEQAAKLNKKIATAKYSWDKQPFSSYELTNNNGEIKRLKDRIAEITRNREVGFSGWEFNGGTAVVNTEINRLQLLFDERPEKNKCTLLKGNGFHWSPTEAAWQRQLTDNAIYTAGRIDFIKPSDGRTVREHQPKVPVKDSGAR